MPKRKKKETRGRPISNNTFNYIGVTTKRHSGFLSNAKLERAKKANRIVDHTTYEANAVIDEWFGKAMTLEGQKEITEKLGKLTGLYHYIVWQPIMKFSALPGANVTDEVIKKDIRYYKTYMPIKVYVPRGFDMYQIQGRTILTKQHVCKILSIKPSTLCILVNKKKIKAIETRPRLFFLEDVEDYVLKRYNLKSKLLNKARYNNMSDVRKAKKVHDKEKFDTMNTEDFNPFS